MPKIPPNKDFVRMLLGDHAVHRPRADSGAPGSAGADFVEAGAGLRRVVSGRARAGAVPAAELADRFVGIAKGYGVVDSVNALALANAFKASSSGGVAGDAKAVVDAEVLRAYGSVIEDLRRHYFSNLLGKVKLWQAQMARYLRMGDYILAVVLLGGLKRDREDLGLKYEEGEHPPEKTIDDAYAAPLAVLADFNEEFVFAVARGAESMGQEGVGLVQRWKPLVDEFGDLVHDAHRLVQSMEVQFLYMRHIKNAWDLGKVVDMLAMRGFDRVDSSIDAIRKLLLVRAAPTEFARIVTQDPLKDSSPDVWINIGYLPPMVMPEHLRSDFSRVMYELVLNAVKNADPHCREHKKLDRNVNIMSLVDGPQLTMEVRDNGKGARDIRRHLDSERRSGLRIVKGIADRNGWGFEISSDPGRGTAASLRIDTTDWSDVASSAPGGGSVLPPGAPLLMSGANAFLNGPAAYSNFAAFTFLR